MKRTKEKNRPTRASVVSSLQLKLNKGKKPTRIINQDYDTSKLIVLPQMRKNFNEEELKLLGVQLEFIQLHPITIRRCTESELKDHLRVVRDLFPFVLINFSSFKKNKRSDGMYDVLVAGERRFRAYQTIKDWDGKLFAAVYTNLSSYTAFFLQQVENTAKIPEREEESEMVNRLYQIMKENDHKMTLSELSVLINRSPSYTSDLVRFCALPDFVRWFFDKKMITYSTAILCGRLLGKFTENRIRNEILHIVSSRMNAEKVREYIQKLIEESSLPSLFGEDDFQLELETAFQRTRRRTVAQQLLGVISRDRQYVAVVKNLIDKDLIGKGKPYSEYSPQNQLQLLTEDVEKIHPFFEEVVQAKKKRKIVVAH